MSADQPSTESSGGGPAEAAWIVHLARWIGPAGSGPPAGRLDESMAAFAIGHGVGALLLQQLKHEPQRASAAAMDLLRAQWRQQQARSLLVVNRLQTILEACERSDIVVLPWKGPLLSQMVFGRPDLRPSHDIDLIAPPSSWEAAVALLASLGFHASASALADLERGCHCLLLREQSTGLCVELHRTVAERWYPLALDLEAVAGRSARETACGLSFNRLHPADEFLFLCVHGARHGWSSLIWICDLATWIAMMQPSAEDIESWAVEWRRLGVLRLVAASAALVRDVFEVELPEPLAIAAGRSAAQRLARAWREDLVGHVGEAVWKKEFRDLRRLTATREQWRHRLPLWRETTRYLLAPNEHDRQLARKLKFPEASASLLRPWRLLGRYWR